MIKRSVEWWSALFRFRQAYTGQAPTRWMVGAIFSAVLIAYWPALQGSFLWNDSDYVTKPALRSWHGQVRIWTQPGATEQYYPVLHTAFWLEHRLWGDSPLGYHLITVLLHAAAACLFGLVLQKLRLRGAWLAALIFALHPVCAESVAWISEQKNTLSAVGYLAAALFFLEFDDRRGLKPYLLATFCFAGAVLSKSVAATLPAVLLVLLWWRRGRLDWRRDVAPLLPWFALSAGAGLFTAWVERHFLGAEGADFALSWSQRTLIAGRALWFYLVKLLWPADLVFIYPRWTVTAGPTWAWLWPIAALGTIIALWLIRHRWRGPLTVALIFAGSLFPVLGFLNVYAFRFSFVADHFQYLAALPVFAAVAYLLTAPQFANARLGLVASLALILGALSWTQAGRYHDVDLFYRTIIAKNPDAWLAHHNLGVRLVESGQSEAGIAELETTLRLKPEYSEGEYNLGAALAGAGRWQDATGHYAAALRLKPDYAAAENNWGAALLQLGQPEAAALHYRAALRLAPNYAEPHYNLALTLLAAGRPAEAIGHLEAALAAEPNRAEILGRLGGALLALGRAPEAIARFQAAVTLAPGSPDAHNNLGVAFAIAGRVPEAMEQYQTVLRLQPGNVDARTALADLIKAGRPR